MWTHQGYGRRDLLKHLGLGGSAYLLPALRPDHVQAAEPPRRVIVFYSFQGWMFPSCMPTAVSSETSYTMGATHTPLDVWKPKIVMPNGINCPRASGAAEAHGAGECSALTANEQAMSGKGGSISIDQFLAAKINEGKPVTLLKSLDLRVVTRARGFANPGIGNMSFASTISAGNPTPLERDPAVVWKRLFPEGPLSGSGSGGAMPDGALEDARRRKRSVLDFLVKEFSVAKTKVSKEDRDKLDQHAQLVREMEMRIDSVKPTVPVATNCPELSRLAQMDFEKYAAMSDGEEFNALVDGQFSAIQAAFACDLSRVAMVSVSFPPGELFGYKPGDFGIQHEHDFCHKFETNTNKPPEQSAILTNGYKVYSTVFAKLLAKLDAVKESDGSSLLDNTAVLWTGQIAKGLHGLSGGRWLYAGGLGGKLKTGRYLANVTGRSNADFFSTITSALGYGVFRGGKPITEALAT
jgi:Protein of unknown function (DUF1552)